MKVIIASDIFGRTKALKKLVSELPGKIEIVDPYHSEIAFEDEVKAYAFFTQEVGLDQYTQQLFDTVKVSNEPVSLLGFSMGASAMWRLSAEAEIANVTSATLFYGSQIRHHVDINPLFPTHLIFPAQEEHFSVAELIAQLENKNNVHIHQSQYFHGFMNDYSKNYNKQAHDQYKSMLVNYMRQGA